MQVIHLSAVRLSVSVCCVTVPRTLATRNLYEVSRASSQLQLKLQLQFQVELKPAANSERRTANEQATPLSINNASIFARLRPMRKRLLFKGYNVINVNANVNV